MTIKAESLGVLERRLDDSNYDRLTQSIKKKEQKNMNDVSVVDPKVRLDNKNDTDNDTIINTDNDTSNKHVTWFNHGPQIITYGDGNDTNDISKTVTSVSTPYKYQGSLVKQPYIYKSYKDACNGIPITHGSDTITHHETPTNSIQVTSE